MAQADAKDVVAVLGGQKTIGKVRNFNELAGRVREGLPWKSYSSVLAFYQVQPAELSNVALISSRTLARRKEKKQRFTPDESDRLLRLARVFASAHRVFDDSSKAARWMVRPNRPLGSVAPMTLLDTDIGVEQVREELGRIEHGIFA